MSTFKGLKLAKPLMLFSANASNKWKNACSVQALCITAVICSISLLPHSPTDAFFPSSFEMVVQRYLIIYRLQKRQF